MLPARGDGFAGEDVVDPGANGCLDESALDTLADLGVRRLAAGADLGAGEPLYLRRPDAAPLPPAAPTAAAV